MNPKNLVLIIGAGTAPGNFERSGVDQAIAWAFFTLIPSIGVVAPVIVKNSVILGVMLLVFGAERSAQRVV